MKPVLIVEGKQCEVSQVDWQNGNPTSVGIFDNNGNYQIYHDVTNGQYNGAQLLIDLSVALKWVGQYDEIFDSVGQLIAHNQREIQLLADEIANDLEEKPCIINEKVQQRKVLKQRTYGLMDAREIVQVFMQDDVDLSGGEEIE